MDLKPDVIDKNTFNFRCKMILKQIKYFFLYQKIVTIDLNMIFKNKKYDQSTNLFII